ncbi:HNH endonuclease [Burkholderia thailandensis]|nr:HNH endonuclease [Burkholderia thailandensis]NOK49784.1 HNH endonuclease [Burkholderia thailandensis]
MTDSRYGLFWTRGTRVKAHRIAYEHYVGPIPEGLQVRHSCDNTKCVNPGHLLLGTHDDNMHDKAVRKRCNSPYGERQGNSKLAEADVRFILQHYVRGDPTWGQTALGRRFSVDRAHIGSIVRRRAWKHLDNPAQ